MQSFLWINLVYDLKLVSTTWRNVKHTKVLDNEANQRDVYFRQGRVMLRHMHMDPPQSAIYICLRISGNELTGITGFQRITTSPIWFNVPLNLVCKRLQLSSDMAADAHLSLRQHLCCGNNRPDGQLTNSITCTCSECGYIPSVSVTSMLATGSGES